ncbi:aspartate aminotransferase family protein [Candidatus Woesearchaeota archaeon]|nr:aspartate aminotransferase family protein [Candidatus Woesearchaeota archaeon]
MVRYVFSRNLKKSYPNFERAEGSYVWLDGMRYLDASSGPSTCNIGHSHPAVIEAMMNQLRQGAYCHTSQAHSDALLDLCDAVASMLPHKLRYVYPVSGGSEAVETAIKLAIAYHNARGNKDKHKIITRDLSYHGATLGAMAASGNQARKAQYAGLLKHVEKLFPKIPAVYPYRLGDYSEEYARKCADDLEKRILKEGADTVAAFLFEPITGATCSAVTPPPSYYKRIRKVCTRHNILLIADEVMTGLGRCGAWLASADASPDIVALGKGLGCGYAPLGAMVASIDVHTALKERGKFEHGFTYQGNPLAAAAGVAVLSVLIKDSLVQRSKELGESFRDALTTSLKDNPFVGEVRGQGMMIGVEFVSDRRKKQPFNCHFQEHVVQHLMDRGILAYPGHGSLRGQELNTLLIAPPLNAAPNELDSILENLDGAIRSAAR